MYIAYLYKYVIILKSRINTQLVHRVLWRFMTIKTLDVTTLPFERMVRCADGPDVHMREILERHRPVIDAMAEQNLVKANDSFGFAMLEPTIQRDLSSLIHFVDDPYSFVWFVGGWGPNRDKYIANAVRKLYPLIGRPQYASTLDMRFDRSEKPFPNPVESQNEDGTFPWGSFPWAGASVQTYGSLHLVGSVSALKEIQDHTVANLILGHVAERIILGNGLLG